MNKKSPSTPSSAPRHPVIIWLTNSACWFTALCLCLLLLNATVWQTNGVSPLRYLLLYPLTLCLSAATAVRRSPLSRGVRYTLHPLLTVGGVYLFGLLPYQISSQAPSSAVLLMVILTLVIYGIVVGVAALLLHKKQVKSTDKQAYESQFRGARQ